MTASSPSRTPFPSVATKASTTAQSSQVNVAAENKQSSSSPRPASQVDVAAATKATSSGSRSSSRSNIRADHKVTSTPQSSSRSALSARPRQDAAATDPTSERATIALIRRTLVAEGALGTDSKGSSTAGIEGILPPLTSSNEVDVQLYAIIAIVIKEYVNSWYSKITPDRTFVDEVIQILAHCTRAVEQRIRQIDMTELLLHELPVLVERHVNVYRTAATAQAEVPYGESPLRIYHALDPHPALDPTVPPEEQQSYEAAYRQLLVQGALAVLLPTEDLANACLRTLVADIIADLILGQVLAQKICQPWFLHGVVSKVAEIVKSRPTAASSSTAGQPIPPQDTRQSRLEQFGLLSSDTPGQDNNSPAGHQSALSAWVWGLLQYIFVAYQFLRFLLIGLAHAQHLPRRVRQHERHQVSLPAPTPASEKSSRASTRPLVDADRRSPCAVISYRVFACIATVLDLAIRMPWLESSFSFFQHILKEGPGRLGGPNSTLDKQPYDQVKDACLYEFKSHQLEVI
ncbi:hypothetical protein ABEF93_005551 [Exophiala dermatitidis]